MAETTTQTPSTETEEKKNKAAFWIRLGTFIATGFAAPVAYLVVRFDLFQTKTTVQIGLWGIVAFIILAALLKIMISYYLAGMKTKYSYLKQVMEGAIKVVVPLVVALVIVRALKDNIDYVLEVLYVLIPCEICAVLVNPLPKWAFDNNVEGLGEITDKVLFRRKGNTNDGDTTK